MSYDEQIAALLKERDEIYELWKERPPCYADKMHLDIIEEKLNDLHEKRFLENLKAWK